MNRQLFLAINLILAIMVFSSINTSVVLLRMKRQGLKLTPEVTTSLRKVINLDVPAAICSGCVVISGIKAKYIVAELVKR